jgi:hypothetical protein
MNTQRKTSLFKNKHDSKVLVDQEHAANSVADVENDSLVLTLHFNGMISDCNKAGGKLLGCLPSELIWQHISRLLPQLKNIALMQGQNLNPYLRFLSRVGYKFDVISLKGVHMVCKVFFCEIGGMGHRFLRVIICPIAQEQTAY